MAIPSGSGTEVLKHAYVNALSTTSTTILNGVANHVYTVLSIVFTDVVNGSDEKINMEIHDSSTVLTLMKHQPVGGYQSFVWNDRLVLSGDVDLKVYTSSGAEVDVWLSYIDQHWT